MSSFEISVLVFFLFFKKNFSYVRQTSDNNCNPATVKISHCNSKHRTSVCDQNSRFGIVKFAAFVC